MVIVLDSVDFSKYASLAILRAYKIFNLINLFLNRKFWSFRSGEYIFNLQIIFIFIFVLILILILVLTFIFIFIFIFILEFKILFLVRLCLNNWSIIIIFFCWKDLFFILQYCFFHLTSFLNTALRALTLKLVIRNIHWRFTFFSTVIELFLFYCFNFFLFFLSWDLVIGMFHQ